MKAIIGVDGSVRLPDAVRARLALDSGTVVRLSVEHDRIVIQRATRRTAGRSRRRPTTLDPTIAIRRDDAGEAYAGLSLWRHVQP